ncbi:uncharacterized protein LOC111867123 isoform X2 [Cryptotermes secundus]|uniref:uncharacterized protein LOC111867123 isoform X2 n=1 Tax=Cryptotermes secundus TaxID=105785 RepID=UPI001454CCBE|nr:uncharacterized protein LOC111867123 isoform X2 [Cryptotermes secundus]
MERKCRDQCQESSTASDSDKVDISVSSRTEVYHQQGAGSENGEVGCQRSELQLNTSLETKHRPAPRKQCKKYLKKRLSKRKARSLNYVNEESNVSNTCSGSVTSPQEPAHVRRSSEQPAAASIVPSTPRKGHVTEEDENDKERQYARNSRRSHLANPKALGDDVLSDPGLSHNLTTDDDNSPSRDINEEIYEYLASGTRNNSSYSTQLNSLESFLAPFLNNQITPGPTNTIFCAQNEDDMKLVHILRYIKSCDGALDLLWDFIHEHAELLTQQQANISRDTVKPIYGDKQYCLGDDLKGGETRELLYGVMGPTQYTRTCSTGSNTEAEERSNAYSDADDSNMEKDDRIKIVDTSSDTVSRRPLTPGIDLSSEGQMILITGDVQEATVLQTGVEENVGDSSLEKVVANETHWTRHEKGQEQQTAKQECPIWQILKKFECPFQWVPDVVINSIPNSTIRENMIPYLTEKEKEFSQAKCNVFREVVVFLILVYEKTLEDRWMEAFADLQHCYNLLGTSNLQCIATSAETRKEKLNLNIVRGNYHFNEIKRRRTNFFYDIDEKGTEKDLLISNGGNENNEISKISKPPKLIARGQFGSSDAELMVQHSAVDQTMKTEKMTGSEEHHKDGKEDECSRNKDDKENANGSILTLTDNEVKDEKIESNLIEVKKHPNVITDCQSDRALHEDMYIGSTSQNASENIPVYLENKKILQSKKIGNEINGRLIDNKIDENENMHSTQSESKKLDTISEASSRGNACDPDLNDAGHVSEEIEKRNEGRLNNYMLEAGDIQNDNNAINDIEKEIAAGGESETERQAQRMAALEYVINATLAHIAYFSESYQEAYNLAKCIEHIYDQLGSTGKATVSALRGAILLEYGYLGNKLGLPFLKKALELDPEYWEWNLYCGKVLSRIRQAEKFKGKTPEQEQVILLEKAVQLNPEDASALVHLANTYRGLSYFSHRQDMKAETTAESVIETRHYVRYGGAANWRRKGQQIKKIKSGLTT